MVTQSLFITLIHIPTHYMILYLHLYIVHFPRSLCTFKRADSVLWAVMKHDWNLTYRVQHGSILGPIPFWNYKLSPDKILQSQYLLPLLCRWHMALTPPETKSLVIATKPSELPWGFSGWANIFSNSVKPNQKLFFSAHLTSLLRSPITLVNYFSSLSQGLVV